MLLPGDRGLAHEASWLLGGSDLTDAIGHVGLFCFLGLGWYWALRPQRSIGRSLVLSAAITFAIGTLTEAAQSLLPNRGMSLFDFLANGLGVALFAIPFTLLWLRTRDRAGTPA